jgi:acyl carrier protein
VSVTAIDQTKPNAKVSINELVCTMLVQVCGRDRCDISLDSRMLDLAVDSLTLVSVLAQVEVVYGIEVTLDDALALKEAPLVSDFVGRVAALAARSRTAGT